MGIQNWSETIVLVDLPQEPEMGDELKAVTEIIRDRGDCDLVVDFSSVDIITSSSISKLLKLNKLLNGYGHRLVLCGLVMATKQIFMLAGLDKVLDFADDKSAALTTVKNAQQVKS